MEQPQHISEIVKFELKSERGVDYSQLRDLLAAGKWKEADEETARVMCLAATSKRKEVQKEDINNFPCEDLHTINQLWLHYSNGKFGFSVQKEIYQTLGGTREYNPNVWAEFCGRVGWRVEGKWLSYENLFYNQGSWDDGHLPAVAMLQMSGRSSWDVLPLCRIFGGFFASFLGLLLSREDL